MIPYEWICRWHEDRPTSAELGMRPAAVVFAGEFWPTKPSRGLALPTERRVKAYVTDYCNKFAPELVVLDIAVPMPDCPQGWWWSVDPRRLDESQMAMMARWYRQLITWTREAMKAAGFGSARLGVFNTLPPISRFQEVCPVDHAEWQRWRWAACHPEIMATNDLVDVICPSLYRHQDSMADWLVSWAHLRRVLASVGYGKPILPFLMPMYYPESTKFVPGDVLMYEMDQLEQCPEVEAPVVFLGKKKRWPDALESDWFRRLMERTGGETHG